MKVIAIILYVIGVLFIIGGIGMFVLPLFSDTGYTSKSILTGVGGLVMGVLFIQGGGKFADD